MNTPKTWTYYNDGERCGIVTSVHHDRGSSLSPNSHRLIPLLATSSRRCCYSLNRRRDGSIGWGRLEGVDLTHTAAEGTFDGVRPAGIYPEDWPVVLAAVREMSTTVGKQFKLGPDVVTLAQHGDILCVSTGDVLVQPGEQAFVALTDDMRRGWTNDADVPMVLPAGTFVEATEDLDAVDGGHIAIVKLGGSLFSREAEVAHRARLAEHDDRARAQQSARVAAIVAQPVHSVHIDWTDTPQQSDVTAEDLLSLVEHTWLLHGPGDYDDYALVRAIEEHDNPRAQALARLALRDNAVARLVALAWSTWQSMAQNGEDGHVAQLAALAEELSDELALVDSEYTSRSLSGPPARYCIRACGYETAEHLDICDVMIEALLRAWSRQDEPVQVPTELLPVRELSLQPLDEPTAAYWRAIQAARNAIDTVAAQLQEARRIRRECSTPALDGLPYFDSIMTLELVAKLRKELPDMPVTGAAAGGGCAGCGESGLV